MKYIHKIATLFVATLFLTTLFVSCSPDIEEEPKEEVLVSKPRPKPEPDWADGVLTIKAGRFKSLDKLLDAVLEEKKIFPSRKSLGDWKDIFFDRKHEHYNPPAMAQERYTFDVVVVPMRDVGMLQEATMDEIRKQYKKHGYRPLTVEETFELGLQFLEQADLPFTNRLHGFGVLSDNNTGKGTPYSFSLCRDTREHVSAVLLWSYWLTGYDHEKKAVVPSLYDPINDYHIVEYTIKSTLMKRPKGAYYGAQFACVKIKE